MQQPSYQVTYEFSAEQVLPGVCNAFKPIVRANGRIIHGGQGSLLRSYETYEEAIAAGRRMVGMGAADV